jgi:hypothetical protein
LPFEPFCFFPFVLADLLLLFLLFELVFLLLFEPDFLLLILLLFELDFLLFELLFEPPFDLWLLPLDLLEPLLLLLPLDLLLEPLLLLLPLEWLPEPPLLPPLAKATSPTRRLAAVARIAIILRLEVFIVLTPRKSVSRPVKGRTPLSHPLIRAVAPVLQPAGVFWRIMKNWC